MHDEQQVQVEGWPRSALVTPQRKNSKRDLNQKTRFSDNNQVIFIPRLNPMVTFAIPNVSMLQFLKNTSHKITVALDGMRSLPEFELRQLAKNWDSSKDPIPLERAVMLHSFLHSCGWTKFTKHHLKNKLIEISKIIHSIENSLSKDSEDHPFIDNQLLYRKEMGKIIDLNSQPGNESFEINLLIVDVLYCKLARMNRMGKLSSLQHSDMYLDILLEIHNLRILEPNEDEYRLYEVLYTKQLNNMLAELELISPPAKGGTSQHHEAVSPHTCNVVGYPDAQGSSLLLAAHQLSRTVTFEHLLSHFQASDLNQLEIDTLASLAKVEKGNSAKKRMLELYLDHQWRVAGFNTLSLHNSIPQGITEFGILLSNQISNQEQQTNIKVTKNELDVLIEITTSYREEQGFNSRINTYLLQLQDSDCTKLSDLTTQTSGAKLYRKSKNDFFYLVEGLASIPLFSVLVSQTNALLSSPKYTVNSTFTLDSVESEAGSGKESRKSQNSLQQTSLPTKESNLELASGNNFLGIPIYKQINQLKCRKYRYKYSAIVPTRKIDQPQMRLTYRSFEEWFQDRTKRTLFPESVFSSIRALSDTQAERKYVDFVETLVNNKRSGKILTSDESGQVLNYARSLHENQPKTVSLSPSVWVVDGQPSSSHRQTFPWETFKQLLCLAASQDIELFPLLSLVSSGKFDGLASHPIMGIKFKTEKDNRIICERVLHDPSLPIPDFKHLKLKIQGAASQHSQSVFGLVPANLKFPYSNIDPRPKPAAVKPDLEVHPQQPPKHPEDLFDLVSDVPEDLFQDHSEILVTDGPRFVRRGNSLKLVGGSETSEGSRLRIETDPGTEDSAKQSEQKYNTKAELDHKENTSTAGMPSTASTGGQLLIGTPHPEVSSFNISSKSAVVLTETLANRLPDSTIRMRMFNSAKPSPDLDET